MSSKFVVLTVLGGILMGIPSLGQGEDSGPRSSASPSASPSDRSKNPDYYFLSSKQQATADELKYINQFSDEDRYDLNFIATGIRDPYGALQISYAERQLMKEMEPAERRVFLERKFLNRNKALNGRNVDLINSRETNREAYLAGQKFSEKIDELRRQLHALNEGDTEGKKRIVDEINTEIKKISEMKNIGENIGHYQQDTESMDSIENLRNDASNAFDALSDQRMARIIDYVLPKARSERSLSRSATAAKMSNWALGSLGFSGGMVGNVFIRCNFIEGNDRAICRSLFSSFKSFQGGLSLLIFSAAADVPRAWALGIISAGINSPYVLPMASAARKVRLVSRVSRLGKSFLLKHPEYQTGIGMILGSGISRMFGKSANSEGFSDVKRDVRELNYAVLTKWWNQELDKSEMALKQLNKLKSEISTIQAQIKSNGAVTAASSQRLKELQEETIRLRLDAAWKMRTYGTFLDEYRDSMAKIAKYSSLLFLDIGRTAIAAFTWSPAELGNFVRDSMSMLVTTYYIGLLERGIGSLLEKAYFLEKLGKFNAAARDRKKVKEILEKVRDPKYRYGLRNELEYFSDVSVPKPVRNLVADEITAVVATGAEVLEVEAVIPEKILLKRLLSFGDWKALGKVFRGRAFGIGTQFLISGLNATAWTLANEYLTERFFKTNEDVFMLPTRLNEAWGYTRYFSLPWHTSDPIEQTVYKSVVAPKPEESDKWVTENFDKIHGMMQEFGTVWDDFRNNVISAGLNARLVAWRVIVDESHTKFINRKQFLSFFERARLPGVSRKNFTCAENQLVPGIYDDDAYFASGQHGAQRWHSDPKDVKSFANEVNQYLPEYRNEVENWIQREKESDLKKGIKRENEYDYFKNYLQFEAKKNEAALRLDLEDDSSGHKGVTASLTDVVNRTYYYETGPGVLTYLKLRSLNGIPLPYNIRSSYWVEITDLNERILTVIKGIEGFTTKDHSPIPELVKLKEQLLIWNNKYYQYQQIDKATMDSFSPYALTAPDDMWILAMNDHDDLIRHRINFMLVPLLRELSLMVDAATTVDDTARRFISPTFTDEEIDQDALENKPLTPAQRYSMTINEQLDHDKKINDERQKKMQQKATGKDQFSNEDKVNDSLFNKDPAKDQGPALKNGPHPPAMPQQIKTPGPQGAIKHKRTKTASADWMRKVIVEKPAANGN